MLRSYQDQHGTIKKENISITVKMYPELDESDFLDENEHKHYQKIIGICQWLVVAGRIDICYAVSSLSRFSAAPRKGHLKLAQQLLGYLKKHQKKGYVVNIKSPTMDIRY